MGQYYKIVNLDKKEYMTHWDFGGGAKLCEHGMIIFECLAGLLADGNGGGGGDIRSENPIIGSWAGDRVMFAGDYADPFPGFGRPEPVWNEERQSWENGPPKDNIYHLAKREDWKNIGLDIFIGMMEDPYFRERFQIDWITKETWYREWMPRVIIALAYALKNIEGLPELGNKAAWVFRELFGDGTPEYYRAMHGLIKHHEAPDLYKMALERELS